MSYSCGVMNGWTCRRAFICICAYNWLYSHTWYSINKYNESDTKKKKCTLDVYEVPGSNPARNHPHRYHTWEYQTTIVHGCDFRFNTTNLPILRSLPFFKSVKIVKIRFSHPRDSFKIIVITHYSHSRWERARGVVMPCFSAGPLLIGVCFQGFGPLPWALASTIKGVPHLMLWALFYTQQPERLMFYNSRFVFFLSFFFLVFVL